MSEAGADPGHYAPELREDSLSGQQVILARARNRRPHSPSLAARRASTPATDTQCPFCPGNEALTPPPLLTRPGAETGDPWSVRVIPNLYPLVSRAKQGTKSTNPAEGSHEVVIETPRHDHQIEDRPPLEVAGVLSVIQDRLRVLLKRPGTRYVAVFKNRGAAGGTSLEHPHSQIVALNFTPAPVQASTRRARRLLDKTGGCALCREIEREPGSKRRIVGQWGQVVAYAPFASTYSGELILAPLHHLASFAAAEPQIVYDLACCLPAVLRAIRTAFASPAFNLVLETPPKLALHDRSLHWYWRVLPRLSTAGGFELLTGVQVNSLDPDEAAEQLRQALS
jgi:UDPglucose--hexose-1-phosphate uridylyltransferase